MNSIFEYDSALDFLIDYATRQKALNSDFNIKKWSEKLGYKNSSLVSDVLASRRSIGPSLKTKLDTYFDFNHKEREFFNILCALKKPLSPTERSLLLGKTKNELIEAPHEMELQKFRIIQDWYHLILLEATALKKFNWNPRQIAKKLKGVSEAAVDLSIDRLKRLKLIKKSKGRFTRINGELKVGSEIPSSVIVEHHRQFLEFCLLSAKTEHARTFGVKHRFVKNAKQKTRHQNIHYS